MREVCPFGVISDAATTLQETRYLQQARYLRKRQRRSVIIGARVAEGHLRLLFSSFRHSIHDAAALPSPLQSPCCVSDLRSTQCRACSVRLDEPPRRLEPRHRRLRLESARLIV